MIFIADVLSAEVIRGLNFALFERGVNYVVVDERVDDPKEIRRMIEAVSASALDQLLGAVPSFGEPTMPAAWSHWMAAAVAQQFWPDGNHRTAFAAFNIVLQETTGTELSLPEAAVHELLAGSKKIIQSRPTLPGKPVFTIEEVVADDHPYRRHFRSFEDQLVRGPWRHP